MYDLRRDLARNVIDQTVKMAIKFDGMQESWAIQLPHSLYQQL
jgi:hypothetical protein